MGKTETILVPASGHPMIALSGYSRQGKDEAALPLIVLGYTRKAFGDFIKERLSTANMSELFQFQTWSTETHSPERNDEVLISLNYWLDNSVDLFTQNDAIKPRLRPILEEYGMFRYDKILDDFMWFARNNQPIVNTRLMRLREAQAWVENGGVLWEIHRTGEPATEFEGKTQQELRESGLITHNIHNTGTKQDLYRMVLHASGIAFGPTRTQ